SFVAVPRASGWLHDELVRRGVKPYLLPSGGAFDLRHLGRLVALTRRLRIDVMQAHTFGTTVYASAAGVVRRLPVVGTFHGFIDVAMADPRRRIKLGALDAGATRIVCVSESLRRDLLANSRLSP